MEKLIRVSCCFFLLFLFFSCSGPRQADEPEVHFADASVETQVEDLKDKIEDQPNNILFRKQLADVYSENGEKLQAMRILEAAFVIDPSDAEMKYQYGQIAMSLGDKLKAYRAYKDVLQTAEGSAYLDRIAPIFVDAFVVNPVVQSSADEAFANFSADGDKIIYQSNQNGNWDIFEYNFENQMITQITNSPAHEENPDFAPNQNAVLYTSTSEDHRDVDYNQKLRDIFIMTLSNKKEMNLTTNGSNDWRPRYSGDGKYITFVSERNDLREVPYYKLKGDVFVMENDGRFQLSLTKTESNNGGPCILPGSTEDNGVVFFDSDRNGTYDIFRMDFKGKDIRQITFDPDANDVSPSISANGDKITFFSDRDGNYEIYMMNADGSAQQRLTSNAADDLNPIFSPDGTKVLFHTSRNGNYDIYLLDLTQQSSTMPIHEVITRIDSEIQNLQ